MAVNPITDTAMGLLHSAINSFRGDLGFWLGEHDGDSETLCETLRELRAERRRLSEIISAIEAATEPR